MPTQYAAGAAMQPSRVCGGSALVTGGAAGRVARGLCDAEVRRKLLSRPGSGLGEIGDGRVSAVCGRGPPATRAERSHCNATDSLTVAL